MYHRLYRAAAAHGGRIAGPVKRASAARVRVGNADVFDPSLDLSGTGTTRPIRMATLREAIGRLLARLALSPARSRQRRPQRDLLWERDGGARFPWGSTTVRDGRSQVTDVEPRLLALEQLVAWPPARPRSSRGAPPSRVAGSRGRALRTRFRRAAPRRPPAAAGRRGRSRRCPSPSRSGTRRTHPRQRAAHARQLVQPRDEQVSALLERGDHGPHRVHRSRQRGDPGELRRRRHARVDVDREAHHRLDERLRAVPRSRGASPSSRTSCSRSRAGSRAPRGPRAMSASRARSPYRISE